MSQNYPNERVRIFDRNGFPLVEFRTSVERSLVIGGEGRALFSYSSRKTDIVNEKNLQYGNWLLVESDQLPAWVGVIDTPREWSPRVVAVHAYTPEHVFGQRRGPLEIKLTGSPGNVFEDLIGIVNKAEPTVIKTGNIWRSDLDMEETINPTPLSEDLQRITERSGEEYTWRPDTDINGRLIVYADWTKRLGIDTSVLLHEGKEGGNIEFLNDVFVEDGDIYNDLLAYGDGMSWQSRPIYIVTDAVSRDKYGLRETSENYTGVSNTNTLFVNGREALAQSSKTVKTFHVNAINTGRNDSVYKYLGLGNSMTLQLQNMGFSSSGLGFETTVRVVGIVMDSQEKNKVELVLEEHV